MSRDGKSDVARVLSTHVDKRCWKNLRDVGNLGTTGHAVVRKVYHALECWKRQEDPALPTTNKGESRLPHVIKYDLPHAYRLVTYQHAGQRLVLFLGNHDDTERWLETHRGEDFAVSQSGRIAMVASSPESMADDAQAKPLPSPTASGPIIDRLPLELIAALALAEGTLRQLRRRVTFEEAHDPNMWELVADLSYPTEEIGLGVKEAIELIVSNQIEEAITKLYLVLGSASTASDSPDEFAAAMESGSNSDVFVNLSDHSVEQIRRAAESPSVTDWMLFLHPDQRKLVSREFTGPSRLIGVSGSGKTSVLVHRAVFLAEKYPDEKVLVLCLNGALRSLLDQLLTQLAPTALRGNIQVRTVYDVCYDIAKAGNPDLLIEQHDPRSGEDLAMCWADFLEKDYVQEIADPIIAALRDREDKLDPHEYLQDELIWVRSGFGEKFRDDYLTCDRAGRGVPFPRGTDSPPATDSRTAMPVDTRTRILTLLKEYEEYMHAGGLRDDDGVSVMAFAVHSNPESCESCRARCVLVDEYQDCSTIELAVIASLPTAPVDGLFLCGDPVQKVLPKQHELKRAGIELLGGRSMVLRKNYRNSKQILEAAFTLIKAFRDTAPISSGDILEPEFAIRDESRPSLYECDTTEQQVAFVFNLLDAWSATDWAAICVCSPSKHTLELFESECVAKGIATERLSDGSGKLGKGIKTSTLENVKGFEFKQMFILDLHDKEPLLRLVTPQGERWRGAFQLYVAMTRARSELVMTYVFNRSILLAPLQDTVHEGHAKSLLEPLT